MATKSRRPLPTRIGEVLIPGRFLYLLDDFFDEVGRRVEKKAAEIAYARKEGSNAGVVTKSDLLEGAGLLAQTLVRDLENSLNASETVHGRRKAS